MTIYLTLLDEVTFNADGLVPVIVQQHDSGEVLMMAWMNLESLEETITTGRMCYWSRSRQCLWRKGESSGQVQQLLALILDCDGDTLLAKVEQQGVACHTGRRSCFYKTLQENAWVNNQEVIVAPDMLYGKNE